MSVPDLLVVHENDNVATALRDLARGPASLSDKQGKTSTISLLDSINLGHKVALIDIQLGDIIVKYGQPIGRATTTISTGSHVHGHNVESLSEVG